MTKAKAAEILGLLVMNDYEPTLRRDDAVPSNFSITVTHKDGILINQLKLFQDANAVTLKAKSIDIT